MNKLEKCQNFFDSLAMLLWDTHNVMPSINNDMSAYLVPRGTEGEVTYYEKPVNSFRISDHWNWFANIRKCEDPYYIQCFNVDVPWPFKRTEKGKPSVPRQAVQVAIFTSDGKYHCVYGDKYDHKKKRWLWVESDPRTVAARV